jgi:hypothetical protein
LPANKGSEHLKLPGLAAEIVGRLRNPFVLHTGTMPWNGRSGAPQCYVSSSQSVNDDTESEPLH